MASIKEIAALANVSIGTVDRVLHNRGRVSKETKARIERIVTKLGYRPNIHARNLSLDRGYDFRIIIPRPSQDSGYWKIAVNGIEKAGRELQVYQVLLHFHFFDRYSERSFQHAFRGALRAKPDGLLLAPVLPGIGQKLIPTIPDSLPYVFIDSVIPGTSYLTFIGQDPFQSGLLAARLMLKSLPTKSSVAIVKVAPEDFHIAERIRGFQSGLMDSNQRDANVYEVDSHGGEKSFAEVITRVLRENKDLGGIFVSNAWTHAIAKFVHEHQLGSQISLIGYDLVEQNVKALEKHMIDFLISQRPEMQGYEGIYCLYEHVVLRDPVRQRIMVPIDILTKENVHYHRD